MKIENHSQLFLLKPYIIHLLKVVLKLPPISKKAIYEWSRKNPTTCWICLRLNLHQLLRRLSSCRWTVALFRDCQNLGRNKTNDGKRGQLDQNFPTWCFFTKKNSSKNPRSTCQIKQRNWIHIFTSLELKYWKILCKVLVLKSVDPHLYTLARVFQKKHLSMYQERVASPKTTCQAIFFVNNILMFSNY